MLDAIRGDAAGPGEQGRALRAPGRLLRRRLGGATRSRPGLIEELTAGRHQRRPRRRRRDRRRPHPAADPGPGQPGDVDARLVGAAPPLVLARLRAGQAGGVRHLLRLDLVPGSPDVVQRPAHDRETCEHDPQHGLICGDERERRNGEDEKLDRELRRMRKLDLRLRRHEEPQTTATRAGAPSPRTHCVTPDAVEKPQYAVAASADSSRRNRTPRFAPRIGAGD